MATLHLGARIVPRPNAAARLGAERRRLLALQHRGLAAVLDAGLTETGQVFVVFEHVRGRPLRDHVRTHPRGAEDIDAILRDLTASLRYAHDAGLAHGALSARGVMVTGDQSDRRAKVLGLGVAHLLASLGVGPLPTAEGDEAALSALADAMRAGVI